MSDIFVTSDTHFNHGNIIKYCNRPFRCSRDMDEALVERWNSVVKPDDHVWHLGDVYMNASKGYIEMILGRLNGKKRLVLGNHDNAKDQILQKYFEKIVLWRDFKEFGILLTHVPAHPDSIIKDRLNVHGHIHQRVVQKQSSAGGYLMKDPRYRCVCVEHTNYTPVNIEELRIR